jgi:predicted AAA+ superfamily ATPase
MEKILEISNRRLQNISLEFKRDIYADIEWNSRCILLNGCRGVGKTYLMLQYLNSKIDLSIYISLDNLFFLSNTLSDTLDYFYKKGIRYFGIDEIHKYPDWSLEIKNIYDNYPDVQLILSSSSALDILAGVGDLSRRLDQYNIKGLSFLEFLKFEYGLEIKSLSWEEILNTHEEMYELYYEKYAIHTKFNNYLKKGYYPYYKEAGTKYFDRLRAVIIQVIESDMAAIFNTNYEATRQMKKLLNLLANIGPFTPNVSKLSRDLSLNRISVLKYMDFLAQADIVAILKSPIKSDSILTKPEKIYFENTNLLYAFDANFTNSGTVRETFTMNAFDGAVQISVPLKGDFIVDDKYVVEVGGKNKNFTQLQGMPNSCLVVDGIGKGSKNRIPLWCLGFLKKNR